jgi:hypothetical protein
VATILLPFHGDSMSGIFGARAEEAGQKSRPDLLEPDEANPGNSVIPDGQRPERRGQNPRQNGGLNAVVHQDATINHSGNYG